ncbi:MAG: hypothetical protein K2G90_10050 [Muribaculaceae bacterium]|nr:hypothetical protein [Muribaculaceae bacterium]
MNRFTFRFLLGITFFAGLMTGCSNDDETPYPKPKPVEEPTPKPEPMVIKERMDISLTPQQKEGVMLQNDFAFRLFNEDKKGNSSNSLISPLSLTMCLSMAANGASEEVRNEIVDNLLPGGGSLDELNSLNKYLVESLSDVDNSSILTLANSAWVDRKFTLLSPFSESIREYYNAESASLNMYSGEATDRINEWVNSTTNGLIPQLFTTAPACDLTLINTMYFNGAWWDPFEEKYTDKGMFSNENGSRKEVDFMNKYNPFNIAITSDYSVLQLPYGNKAFSFYALMPSEGHTLDLTAEKWDEIKNGMCFQEVIISMPKFETEYNVSDMQRKMESAGISKLFNSGDALINTVSPTALGGDLSMVHKTVFKVNEIGAEGAGLTAAFWCTAALDGGETPKTPEIILNRPFIYIVEEQSTGAILFIGAIRNL